MTIAEPYVVERALPDGWTRVSANMRYPEEAFAWMRGMPTHMVTYRVYHRFKKLPVLWPGHDFVMKDFCSRENLFRTTHFGSSTYRPLSTTALLISGDAV